MSGGAPEVTVRTTGFPGTPGRPAGSKAPVKPRPVGRIIPELEFKDDEELLEWLETVRVIFERTAEELDECSGYMYAKLRRYLKRKHRMGIRARVYARSASLPVARAADSAETMAKYMRMSGTRIEAMVEAIGGGAKTKDYDDFGIKGVDK